VLLEVLQVAEIRDKFRLVEKLLRRQVIEIDGIGKALHELGACQSSVKLDGKRCTHLEFQLESCIAAVQRNVCGRGHAVRPGTP